MTQFINNEQKKVCGIICEELDNIDKKIKELQKLAEENNIPFEVRVLEEDMFFRWNESNNGVRHWVSSNMYNC